MAMRTQICEFCSCVYTIEREMLRAAKVYCPICAHMNEVQKNREHNSQSVHKAKLAIIISNDEERKKQMVMQVGFTKPIEKDKLLEELKLAFPTATFFIPDSPTLQAWGRKSVEVVSNAVSEKDILDVIAAHKPQLPKEEAKMETKAVKNVEIDTNDTVSLETGRKKVSEGLDVMITGMFASKLTMLQNSIEKNEEILAAIAKERASIEKSLLDDKKAREQEKKEALEALAHHKKTIEKLVADSLNPIEKRLEGVVSIICNASEAYAKAISVAKKQ